MSLSKPSMEEPDSEYELLKACETADGTWAFMAVPRGLSQGRVLLRLFRPLRDRLLGESRLATLTTPKSGYLVVYARSGVVQGGPYASSPWLARPFRKISLHRWLQKRTPRHSTVVEIATHLASGLGELHQLGLLHLDLRPQNVFRYDFRWQIADYGVRSFTESWSPSALDSPYLAPELSERMFAPEADCYSFGALVAHLFSASRAAPSGYPLDWLHDVPARWHRLLSECLDPKPENRPSASELIDEIARLAPRTEGLTLREVDDVLVSEATRARVVRHVSQRVHLQRVDVEDAVQDVVFRFWTRLHEDPSFFERFDTREGLAAYITRSAERTMWRTSHRREFPMALEAEVVVPSPSGGTLTHGAIDALHELEDRIGVTAARIMRLRLYGRTYAQIAGLISSPREEWDAGKVFQAEFRLRRAYPELGSALPDPDRAEAASHLAAWLSEQGFSHVVPLLSMRLAGYTVEEIAEATGGTAAAITARLYRIKQAEPWFALLLEPTTHWPEPNDPTPSLIAAMRGRRLELDDVWASWLAERIERAVQDARESKDPLAGQAVSQRVMSAYRIARDVRRRVTEEPAVSLDSVAETTESASELIVLGVGPDAIVPEFQLVDGRVRHSVAKVNQILGSIEDPYGVFYWWTEPNSRLDGRSPVELLEASTDANDLVLIALAQATKEVD